MDLDVTTLTAISPVDGRYAVHVELRWLKALSEHPEITEVPALSETTLAWLESIRESMTPEDAQRVKEIERTTNHDVKAVEYWIKERISGVDSEEIRNDLLPVLECTSEDINNLAYGLMLMDARDRVLVPQMRETVVKIAELGSTLAETPMMCRTHGQPASPSTMGKELAVFASRLHKQLQHVAQVEILGKFNGAVGNFNAALSAYPQIDWATTNKSYVESLGLTIEPHDYVAEVFDAVARFNTVLLDFDRDMWGYISLNYFKLLRVEGEVGSSTMPHKVNPIDFENSEGNLGIANALLSHLSAKLPISRWQRDLTDSTVFRNLGVGLAHSLISYSATKRGLSKLDPNKEAMEADLDGNWELLAEPIQTVMRRFAVSGAYEKLKELTRGERMSKAKIHAFIQTQEDSLPKEAIDALLKLEPRSYIGDATRIATEVCSQVLAETLAENA